MLFLLFTFSSAMAWKEIFSKGQRLQWFTAPLDSGSSSSSPPGDIISTKIQIAVENAMELQFFSVTLPCKVKHHRAIAVFGNSANNCTGGATVLGDISLQDGLFQVRTQSAICAWLNFFQQDFITDKEKAFIINWSHL